MASIGWNSNSWKDKASEKDINNNSQYSYVKEHGIMHEDLNFAGDNLQPDEEYLGYTPSFNKKPTKQCHIVFFRSQDYHDNKHKIVGFYGSPEIGEFTRSAGIALDRGYNNVNIKAKERNIVYFDTPLSIEDKDKPEFLKKNRQWI